MIAVPTQISGINYPSISAAARALGVTPGAVWQAMEKGTLDRVGLGIQFDGAKLRKPCWFRGSRYPSQVAAARAHGVTRGAVSKSVKKAKETARQMAV